MVCNRYDGGCKRRCLGSGVSVTEISASRICSYWELHPFVVRAAVGVLCCYPCPTGNGMAYGTFCSGIS